MSEKRLNTEELAKALGVNKMTIYRELKRDNCAIPYNRIGRNNSFLLSEVLLATKVTPLDKKEVVDKLEMLLKEECLFPDHQEGICIGEEIKDVIRFINSTNGKRRSKMECKKCGHKPNEISLCLTCIQEYPYCLNNFIFKKRVGTNNIIKCTGHKKE